MAWKLQYGSADRTFEEWGLSLPRKVTANQGADEVTFEADGALADSEPIFPYDAEIVIRKDGVQWFRGRVVETPAMGDGPTEGVSYKVAGAWQLLDELVYQVQWSGQWSSHLLLNINGRVSVSVGGVIAAVIDYAAANGIAIQKGQIFPDVDEVVYPPADEVTDLSCGEVIRRQMRWMPQGVAWIDYSTATPTLHARRAKKLTKVTLGPLPATEGERSWLKSIQAFGLRRRDDLVRPVVVFKYEIRGEVNGVPQLGFVVDRYPNDPALDRNRKAWVQTFSMLGPVVQTVSAEIETETIDTASLDWWKAHFPHLARPEVAAVSLEVTGATRSGKLKLPRMLVPGGGQIAPWMGVQWEEDLIEARAKYYITEAEPLLGAGDPNVGKIHFVEEEPLELRVIATDATTKVYSTVASVEEGDPIWLGLAENYFKALEVPQWEGQVVLTGEELAVEAVAGKTPQMGTLVSIAGLKKEWATMDALVQQVAEDAESGTMTVSFGPPTHLGAGDFIELLQVGRQRRRHTNPLTQQTGELGDSGGAVQLGEAMPVENSYAGTGKQRVLKVYQKSASRPADDKLIALDSETGEFKIDFGGGRTITVKQDNGVWLGGENRAFEMRWVRVCEMNADGRLETKRMKVIGTLPERLL